MRSEKRPVFVVAPCWGTFDGWKERYGVYDTEDDALAAIGRAVIQGAHYAEKLRVIPLELNGPLKPEEAPDA